MICKNCGAQISDIAKFCPKCGTPVSPAASGQAGQAGTTKTTGPTGSAGTTNTQSQPQQENQKTYQYPYQSTPGTQNSGSNMRAVIALVLGLIAIPLSFATIIGAIIAFIFSIVGIVMASNSRKTYGSSGVATAALVFSIIALIICIIRLLALAACGAACGALMCSMY